MGGSSYALKRKSGRYSLLLSSKPAFCASPCCFAHVMFHRRSLLDSSSSAGPAHTYPGVAAAPDRPSEDPQLHLQLPEPDRAGLVPQCHQRNPQRNRFELGSCILGCLSFKGLCDIYYWAFCHIEHLWILSSGSLTRLRELLVSYNRLSGVPEELGCCESLQKLELAMNSDLDELPEQVQWNVI